MRQEGTLKSLLGDRHTSWPLWIQLVFFCCIWYLSLKAICIQCTYTFVPLWEGVPNGPSSCQVLVEDILSAKWSMAAFLCLFRADVGWCASSWCKGGRSGFFGIREAPLLLNYPYKWQCFWNLSTLFPLYVFHDASKACIQQAHLEDCKMCHLMAVTCKENAAEMMRCHLAWGPIK